MSIPFNYILSLHFVAILFFFQQTVQVFVYFILNIEAAKKCTQGEQIIPIIPGLYPSPFVSTKVRAFELYTQTMRFVFI